MKLLKNKKRDIEKKIKYYVAVLRDAVFPSKDSNEFRRISIIVSDLQKRVFKTIENVYLSDDGDDTINTADIIELSKEKKAKRAKREKDVEDLDNRG